MPPIIIVRARARACVRTCQPRRPPAPSALFLLVVVVDVPFEGIQHVLDIAVRPVHTDFPITRQDAYYIMRARAILAVLCVQETNVWGNGYIWH